MSGRIFKCLISAIAALLVAGCAAEESLYLEDNDVPCTVKVSGIVIDGTSRTPLSAIDVRLELFSPGAFSAHSSVSDRTDDNGKYELEILYGNVEDRCIIRVPGTTHLGIKYKEHKVEVILLKDSTGYDESSSTFTVGNLPIVLTRE